LLATALDPELMRVGARIRAVADFDIREADRAPFLRFHAFVTDPQPSYVTAWRIEEKSERKWYHSHVGGMGNVRSALGAAHYHRLQLASLEDEVAKVLTESDFARRMGDATMAVGGTRKLDYEYQAFVLACRRSLDYLAGALSSYFKTEINNFRKLPKSLEKRRPASVVVAISAAHARHVEDLAFIMDEGRASTRNRIAHYEFVAAGVINLTARGFVLAGGGEELLPSRDGPQPRLQDVLSTRLERLHACITDMIDSFIAAAREEERRA
jgi:hypothetical protein